MRPKTKTKTKEVYPDVSPTGEPWQYPITYPPVDSCESDVGAWLRRVGSPLYRRRIKRAVQMVANYRLITRGDARLSKQDRVACHRLLDTLTFDANRRSSPRKDGTKETLMGAGAEGAAS